MSTDTVDHPRLAELVGAFCGKRILVVGDMVSDVYIVGRPARISREAPVLILHHREEFTCPGGAGNVAYNLAALGAKVSVGGVIGDDSAGTQFRHMLADLGIDTSGLVVDPLRATATKTRVIGRGEQEIQQQIVRIDRVDQSHLDAAVEKRLGEWIGSCLTNADGLILSDYANGVISPAVIEAALPGAEQRGLVTTVDSHGDLFRFKGVTIATPNQPEAEGTIGRSMDSSADLESGAEELRQGMDAEGVLITRGNQGMSLFERNHDPVHLAPTNLREVWDPNGAGDTVSAVVTLALLAGASMREAAVLGNLAAGEVVKKFGAATVSPSELQSAISEN